MPSISLHTGDAAELAELLQFLRDWLATDPHQLDASLTAFVGTRGYDPDHLRADLDRFTFLLGGNDGETLFDPATKPPRIDRTDRSQNPRRHLGPTHLTRLSVGSRAASCRPPPTPGAVRPALPPPRQPCRAVGRIRRSPCRTRQRR